MEIADMIQTVGFPIFVVLWFMFRTEKILKSNTEALVGLTDALGDIKNGRRKKT